MTSSVGTATERRSSRRAQLQLWLAVWRHTRVGWLCMGFLLVMTLLMVTLISKVSQPSGRRELDLAAVALFLTFPALWAFASSSLLASGWRALRREGLWRLQPGAAEAARAAGLTQVGTLVFLAILPNLLLAKAVFLALPSGPAWWAWLLAAFGLPAFGASLGLAVVVLHSMAGLGLLIPAGLFMAMGQGKGEALQDAVEAVGGLHNVLSVAGTTGLISLWWVLRQGNRRMLSSVGGAETAWFSWSWWASPLAVRHMPSGWRGLWLPQLVGPSSWRGVALIIGFSLLTLTAINPRSLPWSGYTALLLAFLGYVQGTSGLVDVWASPRLLHVPGGLQRAQGASPLLRQVLTRSGTLALASSAGLWLLLAALVWKPPWQQWAACATAIVAAWALGVFTAVVTMPYVLTGLGRALVTLASPLPLVMGLALLVHRDWPVASDDPRAWPVYSAVLVAMAALLAVAVWIGSRRAWQCIDWGRQPALPTFALQAAKLPSRSKAR